ncbi:potassium uptake TrkH family protein [Spinactinospora alkalitolerans]|uniref:Potassium uptake TrkH family protein n=1 Tax=Spinactinospora alkalitolerans TaxID=687207 RepID=A0A852U382_9ACTN|nr:potassium transporter TrkG [Spinactinospora alkalitolerans]NYE48410.1 potassium uptake TrkH family protein [Spinactinospora alkalitolerans]
MTVAAFTAVVTLGTLTLMLPDASAGGEETGVVTALFTAVSAVCVTGLIVVDTAAHWSTAGQWVILGLIQIGGVGVMTLASVLIIAVRHRIRLKLQLSVGVESKAVTLSEVRRVIFGIIWFSLLFETVTAAALTARFLVGYGYAPGRALYHGVFHAVSAFNNAGFALYSDSLMGFATDPWIILPIALAVIAGGLGFPVWIEIRRRREPGPRRRWSLHARITLSVTAVLLVVGTVLVTALEWTNPRTLGPMDTGDRLLSGFFHSAMPRTAGFNSLDVGGFQTQTLFVTDMLMFVGGGSAGTAGGIKVTTFALLAFVIYANVRGEPTVHVGDRRLSAGVEQQALVVALLAVGLVFVSTLVLMTITPFTLDQILFEVISAFATVGLSTGITADIPVAGQLILCLLMFIGRIGPITLATALALRRRARRIEYPEERPTVG